VAKKSSKRNIKKTVATVTQKFNDFPCWKEILKFKETYFAGRK
jgi:hypothetical protein